MQSKTRSGPVALDLARYELRRSGLRINIERIPMELLILLARSGGRLLTRSEIIDHLWGKNPWLDADRNLNTAIGKIRRALGDDPERPHYIETAVGKGYRFIAPVRTEMEAGKAASNGNGELVIIDPSSEMPLQDSNHERAEHSIAETALSAESSSAARNRKYKPTALLLALVGAGVVASAIWIYGWKALDRLGWISHDRDTPVWIGGDWMIGEYRKCQMRLEATPGTIEIEQREEQPTLYCGEHANGVAEYEAARARETPRGEDIEVSGKMKATPDAKAGDEHGFHVMPVQFFSRTENLEKAPLAWRCRRNSDSLTCKAAD